MQVLSRSTRLKHVAMNDNVQYIREVHVCARVFRGSRVAMGYGARTAEVVEEGVRRTGQL